MVYTPDSILIFLRQSIMLKADVALFNDLASSDDAVRIKAATKLEQRPLGHFQDHPAGNFMYEPAQIQSLLEGWKSTRSDLVKVWIAQALAIVEIETAEALSLMIDSLQIKLDGPYMEWVIYTIFEQRKRVPNAKVILRSLHDHPNSKVRWRCATMLRFAKELNADNLMALRRLMLDDDVTVRDEALYAAKECSGLGPEDYEILLDVENSYGDKSREIARKVIAKLEATVPGCYREAFTPREPLLRTEGVYYAKRGRGRAELDAAGQWITGETYLRFLSDGTAHSFLPGNPVNFHIASGAFSKNGAHVSFSCAGKGGHWCYEGRIDGDKLYLSSVHAESGDRASEVYQWTSRNWDATPAPKVAKKGVLPFIPVRPQSMTCSDAAKWYLQMVARLPLLLEAEATPEDSRLAVVWETRQQLRETAARSLYDPALKKEFLAEMPLPPLDELRALHGDAALQELFKITQAEVRAFPGTIGEAIGMTCWDGKETWGMTERGWQRQEAQA